jgi:WD40 repeat protein
MIIILVVCLADVQLHELRGHTARVLHLTKSPCGSKICSASADETLRFWDLFPSSNTARKDSLMSPRRGTSLLTSPSASVGMSIR